LNETFILIIAIQNISYNFCRASTPFAQVGRNEHRQHRHEKDLVHMVHFTIFRQSKKIEIKPIIAVNINKSSLKNKSNIKISNPDQTVKECWLHGLFAINFTTDIIYDFNKMELCNRQIF